MFRTIADIRAANKAAGFHFFDRDTMKFFGTTVYRQVYGGRYFVTHERSFMVEHSLGMDPSRPFIVRRLADGGRIETIAAFPTLEGARHEAKATAMAEAWRAYNFGGGVAALKATV